MSKFIYKTREENTIDGIYRDKSTISMLKKLIEAEDFSFDYHNIEFLPEKGEFYEFGIVSPPSFYKSFKETGKELRVPDDANENNIVSFYQSRFKKYKDLKVDKEKFLYVGDSFPEFETEVFRLSTLIKNSSQYQDFMKPYLTIEFYANTKKKSNVVQRHFQIKNIDDRLKYLKRFINPQEEIKSETKVGMVNNYKLNNNSLYTSFNDPKRLIPTEDESIYEDNIPSGIFVFSATGDTNPKNINDVINKKAYCEYDVIGYIITKTKGNQNKKVVKRVFVLNDYVNGFSGPVKFFDSQIKEEENYQYSIHQIINIHGKTFSSNKFKYEKGSNPKQKDFFVDNGIEPKSVFTEGVVGQTDSPLIERKDDVVLSFYRTDDFFVKTSFTAKNKEMSVYSPLSFENIDSPDLTLNTKALEIKPTQPNMKLYAKKGESGHVLILISNIIGEKADITLLESVSDTNLKLINLGFDFDSLILPLKEYRVYRTEEEPKSYKSFPKKPRKIIDPQNPDFVDDIEPNTKYYYYSEAIDIKGAKSEPSEVLKLEMVQEQDHVFALLEVYKFDKDKKSITEKMFEKELIVGPTFLQSAVLGSVVGGYIKEGGEGSYRNRLFGESVDILENQLNPTHKLRVTSKKTRRRFDINTIFSYKEVKEFEDLPSGAELVLEEPPPPPIKLVGPGVTEEEKDLIEQWEKENPQTFEKPIATDQQLAGEVEKFCNPGTPSGKPGGCSIGYKCVDTGLAKGTCVKQSIRITNLDELFQ